MNVLIVDDSKLMRKIIIRELEAAYITDFDEAVDGQEAVEACTKYSYDIVLMDWNMPNMSGLRALKVIRAKGNKVPIIMVTTEAEKTNVIEALKAGANGYICKPFKPDTLVSKIKETVWRAQS